MGNLVQDLRYALRTLRKAPLFTSVAVLSLALGIGANTAIFTLVNQLLLKMLPVRDPEQLVMLACRGPHYGGNTGPERDVLPDVPGHSRQESGFPGDVLPLRHQLQPDLRRPHRTGQGELVSGNYFPVLGVGAALGRVFTAQDDLISGRPSARRAELRLLENALRGRPRRDRQEDRAERLSRSRLWASAARASMASSPATRRRLRIPMMMKHQVNDGFYYAQQPARPFRRRSSAASSPASPWQQAKRRIAAAVPSDSGDGSAARRNSRRATEHTRAAVPQDVDGGACPAAKGRSDLRRQFANPLLALMGIVAPGAADRLLQCGQPADRARHRAAEGNRRAARAGRRPRPPDSANCWKRACCSPQSAALLGIGLADR